ncbi:hypothetical protein GCM10010297_39090 [Streptomyces malachitofuscus]|nr:hypothetical protein GCM10010297_39090 [Streptomyces malachitofuscus]
MRVSLRLIALGLLTAAGAMASTAPATAMVDPVSTLYCVTEAVGLADPTAAIDPTDLLNTGGPVTGCVA